MRCVKRNEQPFYYALYLRTDTHYDSEGYENGKYPVYDKPVLTRANISASQGTNVYAAQGSTVAMQYGNDEQYKRVIVFEDRDIPINEQSVLWIDVVPSLDENGALEMNDDGTMVTPFDYIVSSIQRGLPIFGNAVVTIMKVNAS